MGLAFIKRAAGPLDESGALGGQIQVISLGAGTQVGGNGGGGETAVATTPEANAHALFALLQQYTRYSFAPLVKALATEASSSSGGSSKGPSAASSSLEGEDGGANKENGDGKGKAPGGSLSSASLRALQKKITELELALAQVRLGVVYGQPALHARCRHACSVHRYHHPIIPFIPLTRIHNSARRPPRSPPSS